MSFANKPSCKKEQGRISIFEHNGMALVIKDVHKLVCPNCGEEYTDEETTECLLRIAQEAEESGVLTDVRKYKVA